MKILGELTKGMHLGTHFAHVDTSLYCQLSFYNAASFPGSCACMGGQPSRARNESIYNDVKVF